MDIRTFAKVFTLKMINIEINRSTKIQTPLSKLQNIQGNPSKTIEYLRVNSFKNTAQRSTVTKSNLLKRIIMHG